MIQYKYLRKHQSTFCLMPSFPVLTGLLSIMFANSTCHSQLEYHYKYLKNLEKNVHKVGRSKNLEHIFTFL